MGIFSVLFMGGSSGIVVGFSFATELGCEFQLSIKHKLFNQASSRDRTFHFIADYCGTGRLVLRGHL
jgi:hypothetical protein